MRAILDSNVKVNLDLRKLSSRFFISKPKATDAQLLFDVI